jgi:hypothetical protein
MKMASPRQSSSLKFMKTKMRVNDENSDVVDESGDSELNEE